MQYTPPLRHARRFISGLAVAALFAATAFAANSENADKDTATGHLTVTKSATVEAPADKVWAVVGDFNGLSKWHPAVASSELSEGENNSPGAIRHLVLGDGGTINEELTAWQGDAMHYSYRIIDGALPVSNYESTIRVEPDGDNAARISWKGQFDAAEGTSDQDAESLIGVVYDSGLKNVHKSIDAAD